MEFNGGRQKVGRDMDIHVNGRQGDQLASNRQHPRPSQPPSGHCFLHGRCSSCCCCCCCCCCL
ncbi:unnamed protein product [Spirodela intermedia]|uniref:Cysteine-rich transmembrane CYSTM domain-containing protein n=1 Tax=Spirodela intermedia TaxID=51605 RepID=A0ABN7EAD5_SPIIN|nr:unnamed protein product [Spirodela intermedia]